MDIKEYLPEVKENISLAEHTTFKIGGKARYFYTAENKEDLVKAVKVAKQFSLPFFILGDGSNVLFSDKGFDGLVIKCQMSVIKCQDNNIFSDAGVELSGSVKLAKDNSLIGLEWASGIPGTVGGAVYGNAQAFGARISDIVKSAEVLDIETLKINNLSNKECQFFTKSSVFKNNKKLIIISVVLKLEKGNKEEIEQKTREYLNFRSKGYPVGLSSAGSVFINKEVKIEDPELLKEFPELKEFNKKGEIPSGYLIDKCGLRGKRIGGAQISEKHANFIVNLNKAKTEDVLALVKLAKERVKERFGIELKEEIQIVD